jgi:hypothetical protein
VVPAAVATGAFALGWVVQRTVVAPPRPPIDADALGWASLLAFSTVVLGLATAWRRPDLGRWMAVVAVAWVAVDAVAQTTSPLAVGLLAVAADLHLLLRRPAGAAPDRRGRGSAEAVAGAAAVAGVVLALVPQDLTAAGVPAGFGLAVLAAAWRPEVRARVDEAAGLLGAVLLVPLAFVAVAWFAPSLGGTEGGAAGALGAVGALLAVGALDVPRLPPALGRAAGWALGLAALADVTSPSPQVTVMAVGGVVGAVAALGGFDGAADRARARLGPRWAAWGHGRAVVGWALGAVLVAQGVRRWILPTFPIPALSRLADAGAPLLPVVAVLGLAAVVAPWPPAVLRVLALSGLRERAAGSAAALGRRGRGALAAGDRALAALGRGAARATAPLHRPTAPVDPPDGGRAGAVLWPRLLGELWLPVVLFLALDALVRTVAANASLSGGHFAWPSPWRSSWSLDPTGRLGWGTGDYHDIAAHGYRLSEHREAFLPAVPLLLRWVHRSLDLGLAQAQVLVATASGLATAVLSWVWMGLRGVARRTRVLALVLLLVFPWNFLLYGYGYADATTTALVLGAFVLIEVRRPVLAGVVGGLAAVSRPNGIPIIVALLLFELIRSGAVERAGDGPGLRLAGLVRDGVRIRLGRMRPSQWGVLVSGAGIAAYTVWMQHHAGSALYWLDEQRYYGHEPITHLAAWTKHLFVPWPTEAIGQRWEVVNQVATAAITVGSLLAIPAVRRRFGLAYAWFVALCWAQAWTGSRVFTPTGRLVMPALPFLAVVAAGWLVRRPRLAALVVAASAAGSYVLIVLFTRGGSLWAGW